MDPMTEMFCDESNIILQDLRKGLYERKELDSYNQEIVLEIFRGIHTLKADSTMMLYENMAQVSKVLEELLYCFRGDGKIIEDTNRFDGILSDYIEFFEIEIDKIIGGYTPDDNADELEKRIQTYTIEITSKMQENEREKYHLELSKPKKQRFYIASAGTANVLETEDSMLPEIEAESRGEEAVHQKKESFTTDDDEAEGKKLLSKSKKTYTISEEDREKICQSARTILRVVESMKYSVGPDEKGVFSKEQLDKLQTIQRDLESVKKGLASTDFVPVAKKMEIVVDEMSAKLGKPVKLLVKGEHTPVDFERREKISSALIHLIRNAVDHGIEDMEIRELYGKAPMGLIKLRFSTENGKLKVSVSDDGGGIDTEKVLEKAKQQGLLKKMPEEYTQDEIIDLILVSGMTTTTEDSEYSGRGVGMDVINHNVKMLGGKLKITSVQGEGTKMTMKF